MSSLLVRFSVLCLLAMASAREARAEGSRVTILYDGFGRNPAFVKDWGFSALVEYAGKRILFDTGNNAAVFAANVKAAKVNLGKLDFAVISHRHLDHTAGLEYLLKVNPEVTIYAPKEVFGVFGSALPSSFYRKDESIAEQERYFGGRATEALSFRWSLPGVALMLVYCELEV